jgi:hypothetical protein
MSLLHKAVKTILLSNTNKVCMLQIWKTILSAAAIMPTAWRNHCKSPYIIPSITGNSKLGSVRAIAAYVQRLLKSQTWSWYLNPQILFSELPFTMGGRDPVSHIPRFLSQHRGYTDWSLSCVSSVPSANCRDTTSNQTRIASFHILFNSLFTEYRPYTFWATQKPWPHPALSTVAFRIDTCLMRLSQTLHFNTGATLPTSAKLWILS